VLTGVGVWQLNTEYNAEVFSSPKLSVFSLNILPCYCRLFAHHLLWTSLGRLDSN